MNNFSGITVVYEESDFIGKKLGVDRIEELVEMFKQWRSQIVSGNKPTHNFFGKCSNYRSFIDKRKTKIKHVHLIPLPCIAYSAQWDELRPQDKKTSNRTLVFAKLSDTSEVYLLLDILDPAHLQKSKSDKEKNDFYQKFHEMLSIWEELVDQATIAVATENNNNDLIKN